MIVYIYICVYIIVHMIDMHIYIYGIQHIQYHAALGINISISRSMILLCSEVGKSVDEQVEAQAQDLLEKVPSEALLKWS